MIIKGIGWAFMSDPDIDSEWSEIYKTHGDWFSVSDWDGWIDDGLADVVR